MKKSVLLPILIILICIGIVSSLDSQTIPTFHTGKKIQYNGHNLRPIYTGAESGYNHYSVPCVADWNGDGSKDLLIGYFYKGWIYLYINSGTNSDPVFNSQVILKQNNGVTISVGYG